MKGLVLSISGMLLLFSLKGVCAANAVHPGEYVLSGDSGRLKVEQRSGQKIFSIDSVGANCHTCGLSGRVVGTNAETTDDGPTNKSMVCHIRMTSSGDGTEVAVEPQADVACRQYCGARATFDGIYLKPKAICTEKGKRNARDIFIRHYRAKQFPQAVEALRPVLEQCGDFFSWMEIDRVRNDLSLAYFHMGQTEQCIDTLRKTWAYSFADEEALRDGLPPCDFYNYGPTAKATWHNMRLCGGKPGVKK